MGSSSSNARDAAAPPPSPPPPPPPPAAPGPLHVMDADEDDENVKQLNECAALYLSLQDCLVESDRNWKACQAHHIEAISFHRDEDKKHNVLEFSGVDEDM